MTWDERVEQAKRAARLGGATLGVAATLAVLAFLWRALHSAEESALLALLADEDGGGAD